MHELAVIPTAEIIHVTARPHPMSMEVVHCEFEAGVTIAEILGPNARACRVEFGGMTIPEEWWSRIRPKPGHAVIITRFPEGGSSVKSILRIVAFAALAVGVALTAGLAGTVLPAFLGGFTLTTTTAGLLAAGVGLVGSLIINALIPPQSDTSATGATASTSTDLLSSITGTGNQVNRYGAIPCIIGTVLYYPPYAALPYTELSGDDQYLRCLFDLGLGDPDPAAIQIGTNDLATYTDVETEIGVSPSLFSQDITEVAASAELDTDGDTATKTSETSADELSIDLSFASGLFGIDANGNTTTVRVVVKVEFAPTGSGAWVVADTTIPGFTGTSDAASAEADGIHFANGERKAIRAGFRWKVTNGQYDIRVTRVSTDWGGAVAESQIGALTWTTIRSIRYSTVSTTGSKKFAMRIKATDQLSGQISQLSTVISQPIPVWHPDTNTWVTEFSNNPAFIFRWLALEAPCVPDRYHLDADFIIDEDIIEWAVDCANKEFCYSNALDQPTTIYQLFKDVCAAGRAVFNIHDGRYTVVRDQLQTVPVQVFTPRNSWSFGGTRAFPDQIHAFRVQFINPEANYQQDEIIVYDDGYGDVTMVAADPTLQLATKFEQLAIAGCTNANAAWRLGRYNLAVARRRPNTYSWNADIEYLVCARGNLVHVANDIIGVGLSWGKIKDLSLNGDGLVIGVTTDEEMDPVDDGTVYGLRIRRQDASVVYSQVTFTQFGPGIKAATLVTPASNINPDDLFVFGVLNQDVIPLVITKIEPDTDISAKITAVDAAFDVLNADAGTPPPWTSQITGQPWLDAPNPPDLLIVDSSQAVSTANDAGTTAPIMRATISGSWSGPQSVDHIEVRWRRADTVGAWSTVSIPPNQASLDIDGTDRGVSYQIEARSVGTNGEPSAWVQETHIVADANQPPADPINLAALSIADGVHLTWTTATTQRSDAEYDVGRAADSGGLPDDTTWTNIANVKATSYTDGVTDGVVRWYRIRATTFLGVPSNYSLAVNSKNKSVQDGADKTSLNIAQGINDQGGLATKNTVDTGDIDSGAVNASLRFLNTSVDIFATGGDFQAVASVTLVGTPLMVYVRAIVQVLPEPSSLPAFQLILTRGSLSGTIIGTSINMPLPTGAWSFPLIVEGLDTSPDADQTYTLSCTDVNAVLSISMIADQRKV